MNSSHLAHGEEKEVTYPGLVQFALSLTDSLLFVHYLALILIEIRHRRAQYYVKVRERERELGHNYNHYGLEQSTIYE